MVDRLGKARATMDQVCEWLLSPSPATLDRCSTVLRSAAAELSDPASWLGPAHRDPQALADAWHLRRALRRAGRLLESAHQYHAGWLRIRSAMTGGYHPGGAAAPLVPLGRINLQA